jgi:hypothetical protein
MKHLVRASRENTTKTSKTDSLKCECTADMGHRGIDRASGEFPSLPRFTQAIRMGGVVWCRAWASLERGIHSCPGRCFRVRKKMDMVKHEKSVDEVSE